MNTHEDPAEKAVDRIESEMDRSGHSTHVPQLPLLLRLTQRTHTFSPDCDVCRALQGQINDLGRRLASTDHATAKNLKDHLRIVKGIVTHLKRKHKLTEEKQYVRRYVLLGLGFGLSFVAAGLILVNFGITLLGVNVTVPALLTRLAVSYTIGRVLDRRAKKKGRVI